MPFRFKRRESIRDGVHRIAAELLDDIIADLEAKPPEIHEARKRFKMLRALLRMIRTGVSREFRRSENAQFRRLGQSLGAARDAQVRLETFERLLALPGAPEISR